MILLEFGRLLFTSAIKDKIYPCGLTMSSCLFENAQTRASLKSAFDNLFKKYGRDFADDDEIDLLDLEIVKGGNHIGREKRRDFGSCFKKTSYELTESADTGPSMQNEMKDPMEENYDDIFVRLTQKVQKAQAFPLPPLRRSHASPTVTLSPDLRITPMKPKVVENNISYISLKKKLNMESPKNHCKAKKVSFNDILLELIEKEEAELDKIADSICEKLCKCESPKCFECSLINACLS